MEFEEYAKWIERDQRILLARVANVDRYLVENTLRSIKQAVACRNKDMADMVMLRAYLLLTLLAGVVYMFLW